jgi:hypothetical protein
VDAAAARDDRSHPGVPFAIAERAEWKVIWAGRILVAVGALGEDYLGRLAADFHAAVKARSRIMLNVDAGQACRTAPCSGRPAARRCRRVRLGGRCGSCPSAGRCGDGGRAVHIRGRRPGVRAAAEAAAGRGPGRGRGRGDRTGLTGPRDDTYSASPGMSED